jgi:predicted enzyme related to lactoylglutathione lyase
MQIKSGTILAFVLSLATALAQAQVAPSQSKVAVAPQYDTSHVYVDPDKFDAFAKSFLGTFGGTSSKKISVTVTPTPSTTFQQVLQTPVGTISLFGFTTPIPATFGSERTGYLVKDLDQALRAVRAAGGEVVVAAFPDPIGRDAIVSFPGGVMTQLYWHTTPPSYPAFAHIPENRIYLSPDAADKFIRSFRAFADARVVTDNHQQDGLELGRPSYKYRRVSLESNFGKMTLFITDGLLPYPYGRETTGYEVDDLQSTLAKAQALGAVVLTPPRTVAGRATAMVQFPGGYIAEIHSTSSTKIR